MNKRTTNIALLLFILFIWSYIVYSRFLQGTDNEPNQQEVYDGSSHIEFQKKDSFILRANYRDPFLGKVTAKRKALNTNNKKVTKNRLNPKINTLEKDKEWPSIRYYGLVKNKSYNKGGTAIISINGKSSKVKTSQTVNSVKIKRIFKDSIILVFQKSTKTFYSKK